VPPLLFATVAAALFRLPIVLRPKCCLLLGWELASLRLCSWSLMSQRHLCDLGLEIGLSSSPEFLSSILSLKVKLFTLPNLLLL